MVKNSSHQTKVKIATVLEGLLEKRSLKKITVTELMRQAQMSRQTFYRHFLDIDEVVYWIYTEHAKFTVQAFYEHRNFRLCILKTAQWMQAHSSLYYNAAKMSGPTAFGAQFFTAMIKYTVDYIGQSHMTEELELVIQLYWYGATHVLIEWAKDGMGMSPECIAEYMFSGMPDLLRKYYA